MAGAVALVRAAHPELDAANVIHRILRTARDAGPPGADFTYGYGYLDAAAAVSADVSLVDANPLGDLAEWVRINRRAEATPAPAEPVVPRPEAVPGGAAVDPTGTLLPSLVALQITGAPLLVVGLLVLAGVGLLSGAVRRIRSRRSR